MSHEATNSSMPFARALLDEHKRRLPQCVAHRGFKAKFPENSQLAFEEAVRAGAHALETDLHITKDRVVVLSHDATLKRCFARKDKIIDLNWDQIKDLRTIAKPHVPMLRFDHFLELLAAPEMDNIWVVLDIKLDNDANDIMQLIASTMARVKPSPRLAWDERVVLGLWSAQHIPLALKYSPSFPIMHIGISTGYARQFFKIRRAGFNMLMPILMAPGGSRFINDCQQRYQRPILAWTVNDVSKMKWCIQRGLDGVLCDDPVKFLKVCREYDSSIPLSCNNIEAARGLNTISIWIVITFFSLVLGPTRMLHWRQKFSAALASMT